MKKLFKNEVFLNVFGTLATMIVPIVIFAYFTYKSGKATAIENSKRYNEILGGEHELRKFNIKTTTSSSSSAWFFVVAGGYSSREVSETKIRFYFKNYRGEFEFMEKNFDEVNIKIDNTVIIPFVKFYWNVIGGGAENSIYKYNVTKVILYCKESDFQPEININDLK
jgi:hypothetical protein